jgi:hypothetical protein
MGLRVVVLFGFLYDRSMTGDFQLNKPRRAVERRTSKS